MNTREQSASGTRPEFNTHPVARWLLLLGGLLLATAGGVSAQTFTTLHSFTASDGSGPDMGLTISDETLYGTTWRGGSTDNGVVFRINIDGSGFKVLHSFTDAPSPAYTNSDGTTPEGTLTCSANTLYGTTMYGGSSGYGTVFRLNTDGTGFTNLYSFTNGGDGANPYAGLVLSGNTLFGTAQYGGDAEEGTVFKVNTDGSGFAVLHSFTPRSNYTNSDGAEPQSPLMISGNTLYGTAFEGGSHGDGTVFKLNTDGSGFRTLYNLHAANDGCNPYGGVVMAGNTLYGTTCYAGAGGYGTVFKLSIDGSGFTVLHSFKGGSFDGQYQYAGVIVSDNVVYGTAPYGGTWNRGVVFQLNTDGTGFTNLHSFSPNPGPAYTNVDGALPKSILVQSGNMLYGTAADGGTSGEGTVFRISLIPSLDISQAGANVVLTWPTNGDFTLQSTTNLGAAATWLADPKLPVVLNGRYTLTNSISETRQFYRLIRDSVVPRLLPAGGTDARQKRAPDYVSSGARK